MASTAETEAERTPALVVNGVSHSFGDRKVLDRVSLTVDQGAFVVLLGLNGAGKSTLFSLITRLYDNVTGEITIRGFDVRRRPSQALQRLGVVFQSRTLDIDLTLMQNLKYHAALHGFAGRTATERARQALALVGLSDRASEKVRALSGGQLRRVEIARSMMHHPDLLLLDEATVGLDLGSRETVMKIVRDLVARERLGVLWATHLMDEVLPTDQVVILHKGVVLYNGPVPQLLKLTGTSSVREAFRSVTGTKSTIEEAA
ncbi:ABC transporter ATP-binding protein [Hyphomicrobium facile]|uniref:ABC-2 type transport system ATP-binding protein n=1 Tax=Hyphomicrobium facile TaxID=51670 RepID=A0A1I7NW49_9HYPH|nr:ABC transporter ATP-binding protein [Hyphomicrobium facile]SFV38879.1 ABC-2 type transport system ATP-binding protein [Hyphomicrobium facile]